MPRLRSALQLDECLGFDSLGTAGEASVAAAVFAGRSLVQAAISLGGQCEGKGAVLPVGAGRLCLCGAAAGALIGLARVRGDELRRGASWQAGLGGRRARSSCSVS